MRRFFIEKSEIPEQAPAIRGQDARHIKKVLRLKPGELIGLFDGTGEEYEAKITGFSDGKVTLELVRSFPSTSESPVTLLVAQALLKDRKMDTLVRQLTELGITGWLPFFAHRSVPRPDTKRLAARHNRWRNIAREALKQCGRSRLPVIEDALSFEEVLDRSQGFDLKIIFWEEETQPFEKALQQIKKKAKSIFLMLGPEGGFTSEEVKTAKAAGFISVSLGPRILKSETASVAACAIIQHLFGDLGGK